MEQITAAEKLRRQWAEGDARRDSRIPEPQGVTAYTDIPYTTSDTPEEEQWHLADIYRPEGVEGVLPVIVSVHGGGWFYGDKKLYSLYTKHLAAKGFAVVNFNYRLAPEYKYPSGFSDICRMMAFLAENAEKYGIDMERLYMVGDSAGAQLVSQYSVYATNENYRALFPSLEGVAAPVPAKIALNCGVYVIGEGTDPCAQWYLPEVLSDNEQHSVTDILSCMTEDFPETFLMLSVNDGLKGCTDIMRKRLEELSVPHIYREYGQSDPADGHVFHVNIISPEAVKCNNEQAEFFHAPLSER